MQYGSQVTALLFALLLVPSQALGQNTVTLSGYVRDAANGTPLVGATVSIEALQRGTTTDSTGHYTLAVSPGTYDVRYNFLGYQEVVRTVSLTEDRSLTVELDRRAIDLEEVLVTGEAADRNVRSLETGVSRLEVKELEELPTFMGTVDIMRSLLLLPGVSTVGEGASGFNVRGGSVDQNLILFDDAPIFYTSHLFGFFSPFNADVVEDVTLYRGGIPAQWGGRISSVLDVEQKTGHMSEYHLRGGAGPISSRLTVEGPILDNRTSFVASGRVSYVNWLLDVVPDQDVKQSKANFYDANVGLNHRLSRRDQLSASGYRSYDRFRLAADTLFNWATTNATLKWKHLFNEKLFTQATGVLANYDFQIEGLPSEIAFTLDSEIRYRNLKTDLTWQPNDQHTIEAGASATYYRFNPGDLQPASEESNITPLAIEDDYALQTAFYLSDKVDLTDRLTLRGGVRYSLFNSLGPGTRYRFASDAPREPSTITDTLSFGAGDLIKRYGGFEPRFSLKYGLGANNSVKLSYNRMRQYLHRISNTTAVTPTDIWQPSTRHLTPQIGDQVSVGYFQNFSDNTIITSLEVYYKWIQNIKDYKPGAELLLNRLLITDLISGEGRAYGAELSIKKLTGELTGSLSYTYSRSEQRVTSTFPEERINFGRWYPTSYDRPHELTVQLRYQDEDEPRVSWNFNFVYRTGRPITFPDSKFIVDGIPVAHFSTRNQHRIPDYHRLDLSLRLDLSRREERGWNGSWTFSLYNVYGRENAYSVFFDRKEGGTVPQAYKLSVFGSIFPSLTYTFEY